MTREENLHWLNQEIRTWENECQSKHPIKEALYAARKALEQEPTLEKDGTLIVTTEHYKNVGRVLVQCGTNGALFYQDQEPTTKNDLAVEKTDMIDKSNFSQEQYKTDLQSAYDSGYEQAKNDLEVDWESYKDVDGNSLDDLILDVIQRNFDCGNTYGYKVADEIIGLLPSVTPQEPNTWSLDDAREDFMHDVYNELDFLPTNEEANRIIDIFDRVTSSIEQEPKWIPIKTRKLTDAEEQDMLENSAYYFNYMFDCQLPEDGEEVLVTTYTGEVTTTTFYDEGLDGCYFEFYEDDGDVIAWMPKPKSYKTKSEVEDENDD